MCSFVVTSGHVPPVCEPADAVFHGRYRVGSWNRGCVRRARTGMMASMPCRVHCARKASPSSARAAIRQGWGASVRAATRTRPRVRSWRTGAGATLLIRQAMDRGTEDTPVAIARGIRLFTFGARPQRSRVRARPCCPAIWRTEPDGPACRPSGAASRPDRTREPGGDRPRSPSCTWPATDPRGHPTAPSSTARPRKDGHALRGPRIGWKQVFSKERMRSHGYRSSGGHPRGDRPGDCLLGG